MYPASRHFPPRDSWCACNRQQFPESNGRRSGEKVYTHPRLDWGLWEALRTYAQAEGLTLGETLNRAMELYLHGTRKTT